jgi:hypothetical protein
MVSLFLVMLFFSSHRVDAAELRLWFYLPANLLVDENVDEGVALLQRAAKAGYNGVLLTDSKFCRWGQLPDRYESNVKRFREECRRLNLECFAAVCPVGYSNDLLSLDPNLAEGLPVIDAPFIVKDGTLVPEQPATPILKNGGFEEHRNNMPTGWGFADDPGKINFIDNGTKYEGNVSLRMQGDGTGEPRNARVMQKIDVKPFHYYHVSVMLKTENFDSVAATNIAVIAPDGRQLNWHMPLLKKTEDWRRIDITFNSLEYTTLNLYFGTWGTRHGKIWWEDVRVEPAGFVNILRRDGTPLTVKSEDGKIIYIEEKDFEKIVDPKLGNDPYTGCFTAWHEQPAVRIPKESRIKEGQRVLVSFTHTSIIYGEQVGCCMSNPKFPELLKWQIEQVHQNVEPDGYFMSHDEIRQCGWDGDCTATGKTPAEILADNVALCVQMIRKEDPDKPIAVWSDMFDPTHNAQKTGHYYHVKGNGPWFGSWEKLPHDVVVANWNSNPEIRGKSLKHFSQRGHPQILAGYYDAEPIDAIQDWIRDAASCPGFCGVMYTTWEHRYDRLEAFAESVKREWDHVPKKQPD